MLEQDAFPREGGPINPEAGLTPERSTLYPQPWTLNPQPSTLNPQPSTPNPQPSTLDPQPSTPNHMQEAVRGATKRSLAHSSANIAEVCQLREMAAT